MATRTHKLAQPKANRLSYPDRRSVYWLDELPPERTGPHTKIHLTPRWSELCRSKKLHTQVTLSPIWEVSEWALRAVPSKRLCSLAQPRAPAAGWEPECPLLVPVTPKHEHRGFEGGRSVCWPISRAARSFVAGERLLELSVPKARKALFEGYDPYVVSRAARSASPSPRIQELSLPLPRKCSSK
ncbi:testicular haploid expressed gene protein [Pleuronectes platessa]|uniref:testicular haploid expressed gene protein n=1 Tax=Pleuronectes platessa TaxID=8262 RepID=UPI00232A5515|nr:testicular haploid expressed gene protein [Pleuronectes platessa]